MNANDIFNLAMSIFKNKTRDGDIYDVDMFAGDIRLARDWEAEETPVNEFSAAVVMLIRDDTLLFYYGFVGLSIIAAELLDWAGNHLN